MAPPDQQILVLGCRPRCAAQGAGRRMYCHRRHDQWGRIGLSPQPPGSSFVLPRDSEEVFEAGKDLLAAVEWLCSSGELIDPFEERDFEPLDSRKENAESSEDPEAVADPGGESLDNILELGKQWAKRHSARKLAKKDLKPHSGKGRKTELL